MDIPTNHIRPITEGARSLANWIAEAQRTRRPILVTQRGRVTGVLLAVEDWESAQDELARLRAMLSPAP